VHRDGARQSQVSVKAVVVCMATIYLLARLLGHLVLGSTADGAEQSLALRLGRSKTFRADVAAVGALPYMETTPKAAVNPGEEGEGGDDVEGTMRDMLPAPGGNQAQQ
jgi:hypothetical protein